jgi:4-phosphopantoate--beta-alanine ligase
MKLDRRHPRFHSLAVREKLVRAVADGIMVPQGLIAHGRGEAFNYFLGEKTTPSASRATSAAAGILLTAQHPVISVNGNTAALVGSEIVRLASMIGAPLEVNLFHRTPRRENRIARYLLNLGAKEVLAVGKGASMTIRGVASSRRRTDPKGIGTADVVFIPLEDGDRAEALKRAGKTIIAVDLNPLSRTSQAASVTIVDDVVRAIPNMIATIGKLKKASRGRLRALYRKFDNEQNLANAIQEMIQYLGGWINN